MKKRCERQRVEDKEASFLSLSSIPPPSPTFLPLFPHPLHIPYLSPLILVVHLPLPSAVDLLERVLDLNIKDTLRSHSQPLCSITWYSSEWEHLLEILCCIDSTYWVSDSKQEKQILSSHRFSLLSSRSISEATIMCDTRRCSLNVQLWIGPNEYFWFDFFGRGGGLDGSPLCVSSTELRRLQAVWVQRSRAQLQCLTFCPQWPCCTMLIQKALKADINYAQLTQTRPPPPAQFCKSQLLLNINIYKRRNSSLTLI